MRFVKSHGAGNDFVMVFDPDGTLTLDASRVAKLCDRREGIGADGLIRIVRSDVADKGFAAGGEQIYFMDYYNADGGPAEMCGNGIRCMALYLLRRKLVASDEALSIATRAGTKRVRLTKVDQQGTWWFQVDMGPAVFELDRIPLDLAALEESARLLEPASSRSPARLSLDLSYGSGERRSASFLEDARGGKGRGASPPRSIEVWPVSMGNPHAIVPMDAGPDDDFVATVGRAIETHPLFPEGTNVEFVWFDGRGLKVRVWERGVGETASCGTGACAVGVASQARQLADLPVRMEFPGGALEVDWEDTVSLTGPAVEVYEGRVPVTVAARHYEVAGGRATAHGRGNSTRR